MNPTVKIESNKYDDFLILHNNGEERGMVTKTLFDAKYDNLKNDFIIKNDNKVYSFIKDNENVFNLLEEVKPYLNHYFRDDKYYLEVRCYPEIYEKELTLVIKVDYSKEDLQILNNRLTTIFLEINDYKIKLGLLGKFFLTMEAK